MTTPRVRRHPPYTPVAARALESRLQELAESVHGPTRANHRGGNLHHSDWDWLEDKMRLGEVSQQPCLLSGGYPPCLGSPTKVRLLPPAMELDLLPLEARADPALFVNLCDLCFLLKLARIDFLPTKSRWVRESSAHLRLAPKTIRWHYSSWANILHQVLTPALSTAEGVIQSHREQTVTIVLRRWELTPPVPEGLRILHFDASRLREDGSIRVVLAANPYGSIVDM